MDSKRWMVGLDFSAMDEQLIKWVNFLAQKLKPEVVYFIHSETDLDVPTYLDRDFKSEFEAKDEQQERVIKELVSLYFDAPTEVKVEIVEGNPMDELLHWSNVKKIDLFIAGKKRKIKGSGLLPNRLSRSLSCSVLFVPEGIKPELSNILMSLDFSEHARLALDSVKQLNEFVGKLKITCLHAYKVPIGYYKTGKTYEQFAEIMEENARKEFDRFTADYDLNLTFKPVLLETSAADTILDEIENEEYDLTVLGSLGQSTGSFILLGSTSEKVLMDNNKCSSLITKKPGEHVGVFEAIGKL